ncbi:MAG: hypothetical protein V1753_06985 [Pseudomonadota bacterium]
MCTDLWFLSIFGLILVVILGLLDLRKNHGLYHDITKNLWPRALSKKGWGGFDESIARQHGFVCAFFFVLLGVIRWLTPTFLLIRPLPICFNWRRVLDPDPNKNKSLSWWHDLSYLLSLATLFSSFWLASYMNWTLSVKVLGGWLLLDIMVYHVNMFWLDDLRPKKGRPVGVWSFRRVSFQAIISYVISIFVFGLIYGHGGNWQNGLKSSLGIATLNPPEAVSWLVICQLIFSLLMLTIVISGMASHAFARGELADKNRQHCEEKKH